MSGGNYYFLISTAHAGERFDSFLASQVEGLTRSRAQGLIRAGHAAVNDRVVKASYNLKAEDCVVLSIPSPSPCRLQPEHVDFAIVHEDASLIVLDKPAGLVVHPAPGHATGTLVHGLLDRCSNLSGIGDVMRPGIVHRLDKGTSGLMVVAKNDRSHESLSGQFKSGEVLKEYVVFTHGGFERDQGEIDRPIGRDRKNRKKMAVVPNSGKRAVTLWRVSERWGRAFACLSVTLLTGRTHQIRVHLSYEGHPVVGDPVYGLKRTWWKQQYPGATNVIEELLGRQMLHSRRIGFRHPDSGRYREFTSPLPSDMVRVGGVLASIGRGEKTA